jgi:hypothetical protein
MKRISVSFCLFILSGITAMSLVVAQEQSNDKQSNDISNLIGNWSGESLCVNRDKFPACHDEQVVYRTVKSPGKSNGLTITMDKIVNGKPETMGVLDFAYNAQKQTLAGEFARNNVRGIFELTVKGDLMEGTLSILPERTLVRRIKVKKDR